MGSSGGIRTDATYTKHQGNVVRGISSRYGASGDTTITDGTTTASGTTIVVVGGTVTDQGNGVIQITVAGSASDAISTITASGSAQTLDVSKFDIFDITLTANCTLTFTGTIGSGVLIDVKLILRQGGSGSYTVTWPASVKWQASDGTNTGSAPTLFTAVGAQDGILLETVDGGTTWGGSHWPVVGNAGTVTSVALTVPAEFSVSGSPVTSSGTLAISKANESANTVWAGPTSGSAAAPTFRALVAADVPMTVGASDHAHVVSETHLSNGSTTTWTLDEAYMTGSVIAWNTTTLARLDVTEVLPDQATVSAAGTSGDKIVFDYAAIVV